MYILFKQQKAQLQKVIPRKMFLLINSGMNEHSARFIFYPPSRTLNTIYLTKHRQKRTHKFQFCIQIKYHKSTVQTNASVSLTSQQKRVKVNRKKGLLERELVGSL